MDGTSRKQLADSRLMIISTSKMQIQIALQASVEMSGKCSLRSLGCRLDKDNTPQRFSPFAFCDATAHLPIMGMNNLTFNGRWIAASCLGTKHVRTDY
ncbi:hypothetical protein DAI22_04g159900 [Oryza sativa Japonica Group]|jgi:hypothetical protein|nr:hypothetical protein DAI22_04g159900 [Oryza sativa Japonica Group]